MSAPKNTANHFDALDGWRGLCACLVALFHFHGNSPVYSRDLIRNSYLFVDFFFVLSGFVIAWNYGTRLGTWADVRQFLVLRVGRLYPFGLALCQRHVSAHICASVRVARQPSSCCARAGSA